MGPKPKTKQEILTQVYIQMFEPLGPKRYRRQVIKRGRKPINIQHVTQYLLAKIKEFYKEQADDISYLDVQDIIPDAVEFFVIGTRFCYKK